MNAATPPPAGAEASHDAREVDGATPPPAVVRLRRRSIAWRLTATALALGVLVAGQVNDTDDYFPLGSLSQYGAPKDLNGSVRSVYLEGLLPGETEPVGIGLSHASTGVARGEIEGQLGRFVDDPSLLQSLADAYAQLRPERAQPEVLYLRRSVTQLEDGRAVGEPEILTLAEWEVQR
ncbi:hypothetical protein [Litorihabitans aurantiacus]|uniref:Uncharacterized protein n=1 Tax=Litorihabitans aurantiacus TaxID=1930061 RepID=A0AA37UWI3_9MICO|nr:hypothetical protein [Litorihabitans aurantiacus]GMA30352.1 hypothetical protein GCM10025875_03440 [Litorihabitans aurantiacus]